MNEEIIKGYKATDANIKCRDYQFTVGEWHRHDGELVLCESGFHFCPYPSGPWCYYSDEGVRIWEVEAKGVIQGNDPGADLKYVAKEIRLVREIIPTGNLNTGYSNTGDRNTGHRNTGNYNTGYSNTGDCNTGNRNSGDINTGHYNTGDRNTGERNTGYYNTGNYNSGDRNTGNYNTGNYNSGNCNTGYYNSGNYNSGNYNTGYYNLTSGSSGFFEIEEPCVSCFGKQTEFKKREFALRFRSSMHSLYNDMKENLDATELAKKYSEIPGVSVEAIEKWKAKYKQLHGTKQ